jgi:hypothetical protein
MRVLFFSDLFFVSCSFVVAEWSARRSRSPDAPLQVGSEPTLGRVVMGDREPGAGSRVALARPGESARPSCDGKDHGLGLTFRLFEV